MLRIGRQGLSVKTQAFFYESDEKLNNLFHRGRFFLNSLVPCVPCGERGQVDSYQLPLGLHYVPVCCQNKPSFSISFSPITDIFTTPRTTTVDPSKLLQNTPGQIHLKITRTSSDSGYVRMWNEQSKRKNPWCR